MKKRNLVTLGIILVMLWMMAACEKTLIEIDLSESEVTIIEGDIYDLEIVTTDAKGFIIEVESPTVISVDASGKITALQEGVSEVIIRSITDDTVFVSILVTVEKRISVSVDQVSLVLKEGDEQMIAYTSNDSVVFLSSNTSILTVDAAGKITALKEGNATLTVRSQKDPAVEKTISVEVRRNVFIVIETEQPMLWIGENLNLDVNSNAEISYASSNPDVATVDQDGKVIAVGAGTVTITIQSLYDANITETYTLTIYSLTTEIVIQGDSKMNVGTTLSLTAYVYPNTAYPEVIWTSSDALIATFDSKGNMTAHQLGSVTVTATSVADETKVATLSISIVDTYLISFSAEPSATLKHQDVTYVYGIRLFKTISEALAVSDEDATIHVLSGTYSESIVINKNGLKLIAMTGAILTMDVSVNADNVQIHNFIFQGEGRLTAQSINGLTFTNNTVRQMKQAIHSTFMTLTDASQTEITFNRFEQIKDAISIHEVRGSLVISENIFDDLGQAIVIKAHPLEIPAPVIRVMRNHIKNTEQAIELMQIEEVQAKLDAIVRFNAIENYVIAAKSNPQIEVDFTLNYWGTATPDNSDFIGIDPFMRRGFYTTLASIPKESDLKTDVPLFIEITSDLSEIVIGETHTITYSFLPMEFSTTRIRFLTSDPVVLGVTQVGVLSPLRSGTATITVRSSVDTSVLATITIIVTTTPGIEFAPSEIKSDVRIGDTFDLNATTFPVSYQSQPILYESSNSQIASISATGKVTALSSGLVTFTAHMENHPDVINTLTIFVYGTLDTNNVLDMLSTYQVMHTPSHTWTAFGQSFNYIDKRYQSVSRYYFGDIAINTSKIVPVSTGIRPGEGFSPHPEGITQYNPYNVYWVVLHDTANTSPGSGALAHANYLWNLYASGQQPFVSWHFTIDSQIVYQHLPEIERGFHAGDGSVLPGQSSTYFGGGNRNGIGIEMAINQDGDMYRTWQRTAKLVAQLLIQYNLPLNHMAYHVNFSGKDCPRTLRNAGLIPLFEEFAANEYHMRLHHPNATMTFESDNPDILDNHGRIIKMPDRGQTVSYTITVNDQGITSSRTFYTYVPGTVK
jgi:N-acetylmuramoyl-L-alanine amidase